MVLISIDCLVPGRVHCQEPPAKVDTTSDAEKLAASLGDVDLNKRRDAAYQLATMGKDALPALDALESEIDRIRAEKQGGGDEMGGEDMGAGGDMGAAPPMPMPGM